MMGEAIVLPIAFPEVNQRLWAALTINYKLVIIPI
ncbi:protein of unknown function [Limnospira indica PCC 8005]|uniref:Uncharacterized protein n=1 Tax=Limnospira indica PCC 8005 TaxID=376219 RepID=A0A9P1NXY6_9CYAN|nr:protein of unknown function [Limnospira indica PCC 8005]